MPRPKKVHFFQLTRFNNRCGTESWKVAGTPPNSKRVRKNFASKAEAIQAMTDLEAKHSGLIVSSSLQRTRLTSHELASAEAAVSVLAGRDVSKITRHYLALEARAAAISRDSGKTRSQAKRLEDKLNHGYCYTALAFAGDRVLLAYCSPPSSYGLETLQISSFLVQNLY